MDLYIALVHHPVLNRRGDVVTTAVTNLDIHDLARSARTYGARAYLLVTPIAEQRALVSRIADHWRGEGGRTPHPQRAAALELVRVVPDIESAIAAVTEESGRAPYVVGTSANATAAPVPYRELRDRLEGEEGAALLLFGTGWGITSAGLGACDAILPPIEAIAGRAGYNHLSVRAAVAIVLDRLVGARS